MVERNKFAAVVWLIVLALICISVAPQLEYSFTAKGPRPPFRFFSSIAAAHAPHVSVLAPLLVSSIVGLAESRTHRSEPANDFLSLECARLC